jgi:hypothetical protein
MARLDIGVYQSYVAGYANGPPRHMDARGHDKRRESQ